MDNPFGLVPSVYKTVGRLATKRIVDDMYQLSGQCVAFAPQLFFTSAHGCFDKREPLELLIIINGSSYRAHLLRSSTQIDVAVLCILDDADIQHAVVAEKSVEPLTRCALVVFDISRDSNIAEPVYLNKSKRRRVVSLKVELNKLSYPPDCRPGDVLSVDKKSRVSKEPVSKEPVSKELQMESKPKPVYELARATYGNMLGFSGGGVFNEQLQLVGVHISKQHLCYSAPPVVVSEGESSVKNTLQAEPVMQQLDNESSSPLTDASHIDFAVSSADSESDPRSRSHSDASHTSTEIESFDDAKPLSNFAQTSRAVEVYAGSSSTSLFVAVRSLFKLNDKWSLSAIEQSLAELTNDKKNKDKTSDKVLSVGIPAVTLVTEEQSSPRSLHDNLYD